MASGERWKYDVVEVKPAMMSPAGTRERVQTELDSRGMQGWELVQVVTLPTRLHLIFKKPA
jgi:hypothetical protein